MATTRRSLLDPLPGRGRMGMVRDMMPDEDGEDDDILGPRNLFRSYKDEMLRVHGQVPTLGEIVSAAIEARTCHDDGKRDKILGALRRTGTGFNGSSYGFLVHPGYAENVFDRARAVDGPFARTNWWPVRNREYKWPAVHETSRARGSRYGGITSVWGYGETHEPTPSDGKVDMITFVQNRLLVSTLVSEDIWSDSDSLQRWITYAIKSEFRAAIESAMILGAGTANASVMLPQGVVGAPSTVSVTRTTSNQLKVADIQNLWAAIAPANKPNATFYANSATINVIDALAISGQFPPQIYFPRGYSRNPYATIFGADLVPSEFCPAVGTVGDLICADFGDYCWTYLRMDPQSSPLSIEIDIPSDMAHRGVVGMPEGSVEARASNEKYFDQSILAINFKWRGDGRWMWANTSLDVAGNVIGPAATIHA